MTDQPRLPRRPRIRGRIRPAVRGLLKNPTTPWNIFLRSALICALAGAVLFGLSLRRIDRLPLDFTPPVFDGNRAHQIMTRLSKDFPNRVTWSDSRRRATKWLKEGFAALGYQPRGMLFPEVIAGKQYNDLENVWAEKRGKRFPDEIIVVAAHYDITDTTVEGAMDDATGIGVIMELARVFANEQPDRTILFLATDSEEFGAFWGARQFAQRFDRVEKIVAVANFDFVAPEKQVSILTLCDGLKQGYTPLWLRELALDSIRSLGEVEAEDFANFMEFVERAILIPPADHGAFLAAGIPSFNWVGQTDNFARQMAHYHHTPHDVAEAILPESMASYGRAAERLVRSIDSLPRIPADFRDGEYWKISPQLYIDGWVAKLLHVLAFIPFLAYSLFRLRTTFQANPPAEIRRALANEAKDVGILLGSLLVGYVVMLLLPALRIIESYETFPATQKSLILYNPSVAALLIVGACVAFTYFVFRRVFREKDDELAYLDLRHAFHGGLLTAVIAAAMLKNTFQAVLLLLPPAYLWMALRIRRRPEDRILNTLLLLGGVLSFVLMVIVMSTIFHIGVVYWYLFLSAAYGLISAYAVVLFLVAVTILVRLFRAFVL
jgi:hypothetical protein